MSQQDTTRVTLHAANQFNLGQLERQMHARARVLRCRCMRRAVELDLHESTGSGAAGSVRGRCSCPQRVHADGKLQGVHDNAQFVCRYLNALLFCRLNHSLVSVASFCINLHAHTHTHTTVSHVHTHTRWPGVYLIETLTHLPSKCVQQMYMLLLLQMIHCHELL